MWCGKCQADVPAEVAPDNQRVFCAVCGTLLSSIDAPPVRPTTEKRDKTQDARDLLQRWSSGAALDPFAPIARPLEPSHTDSPKPSPTEIIASAPATGLESNPLPTTTEPLRAATTTTESASVASQPTLLKPQAPLLTPPATSAIDLSNSVNPFSGIAPPLASAPNLLSPTLTSPLTANSQSNDPFATTAANTIPNPLKGDIAPAGASPYAPLRESVPPATFHRVDAPHPADQFSGPVSASSGASAFDSAGPFVAPPARRSAAAEPQRPLSWLPSWDPGVWRSLPTVSANWSAAAGQFLAYAGVLGLTSGACLVVWSYFGGPAQYAPTGWLIATAGQMLLFFGVVTLVSGGLEQTSEQVTRRIEQLGDHIIRIEQAARQQGLSGSVPAPHLPGHADALANSRDERSIIEQ